METQDLNANIQRFFLPGPRLSVDLIELNLQEAEVAKLFLNSWRYVAFGIANQFPGPKMV